MNTPVVITACYVFVPFTEERLKTLQQELKTFGQQNEMRGLVLIASEGLNGTVAGGAEAIMNWKKKVTELCGETIFKDSSADHMVFRRWSVKIKPEIVALKKDVHPNGKHKHLTPAEWNEAMEKGDAIIIDTRNDYEVAIGKFEGAIDPKIKSFHEFPEYVEKMEFPKDKKFLIYCTGGIRCEKALLQMEKQGYENVYQLEGGILGYLQQFPEQKFEGECFVFDHRVSVDQKLHPSQTYGMCPHCGNPGDQLIKCFCGKEQKVCTSCLAQERARTCSKNCAHHYEKRHVTSQVG